MSIDKTWMFIKDRRLPEWQNGMKAFLDMAFAKIEVANTIRCPCRKCVNVVPKTRDEVALDLCKFGMDQAYKRWIFHGEELYDEPFDDNNGDIDIRSNQERCDDASAYEMINNMIRSENLASTTMVVMMIFTCGIVRNQMITQTNSIDYYGMLNKSCT